MKELKISIIIALIAIAFGSISMSIMMRGLASALKQKEIEIHSLVDEIGDVKQENFELYQSLQTLKTAAPIEKKTQPQKTEPPKPVTAKADNYSFEKEFYNNVEQEKLKIVSQDNGLLDVLILGTHSELTDTIILASANPKLKTISLISIPRDLFVRGRKINELYETYGPQKLGEEIAKITGISPDKYIKINMDGFIDFVDRLGGIDIIVEKNIYDAYFPSKKEGIYQPYSISAGAHHLSGEKALRYVRSRKTTSDFDRTKRQQQVMLAIKEKILAQNFLTHIKDAIILYDILRQHIVTDIDIFEALLYLKNYKDYRFETGNVLSTENFLYSSITEKGAYILLPRKKDFSEIQAFASNLVYQ